MSTLSKTSLWMPYWWISPVKLKIQQHRDKVCHLLYTQNRESKWYLCHDWQPVSHVPCPAAVYTPGCSHFCGPAGGRTVFSSASRTPFISQPVTLGHCLLTAEPGAPTVLYMLRSTQPAASHKLSLFPIYKAPELFFVGLDLKTIIKWLWCLWKASFVCLEETQPAGTILWRGGFNSPKALNDMNITAGSW